MACDSKTLELLSCYVDGEATPDEAARAEAHLEACPECREMVQEWRRGLEMLDWAYLRSLPENIAESYDYTPAPEPQRAQRRTFALPDMRLLAAAAVLALIAIIGTYVYQTMISLPMLGRGLATARQAQTVLVAEGIRLEVAPNSEISRLGDKAIRLVQGAVKADVVHGRGFRILTRKLEIIDEGTKFEVHSDSATDSVTVTEGRVLVRKGRDEYHVGAGETLTSTGDSLRNETHIEQSGGNNMQSGPHGNLVSPMPMLLLLILSILAIVFWVRMLVDTLTRDFKDGGTKIAWVLVIFFGQLLGALIYYAVIYKGEHPRKPFVLAGRNGDQRVILWWNVLLYLVLALFVLAFGILAISPVLTRLGGKLELLIFIALGVAAVLIPIIRAMKLPLDKLPGLDGVTPSGGGGTHLSPWILPVAVCIIAPAIAVGYAVAMRANSISQLLQSIIQIFWAVFWLALVVQARVLGMVIVGRQSDRRVIVWRNIFYAQVTTLSVIYVAWVVESALVHRWTWQQVLYTEVFVLAFFVVHILFRARVPLDKLPSLDSD